MNHNARTLLRAGAVGATATLLGLMSAAPGLAAGHGDVAVANTETIQVYTSATGDPEQQRVYEQLAFTGNGTVHVSNPISTDGLRNLDGFTGFDVEGGRQVADVTVNGERRLRTVSDYDHALPLDVSVSYLLDGKPVEPGDVVGESGILDVRYRVTNTTGQMRQVTFDDGTGRQMTARANVVIPIVGQLETTLPASFTDVRSDEANIAGDGRGGTLLKYTMTLFPPIGSATTEFGYQARIIDGVVPEATVSALPVNPLRSPTFSVAKTGFSDGASKGADLVTGANLIDENLLKLRDGAAELLGGLIRLRDGAQQLDDGLSGEAVPGSQRLADGADRLDDGLNLLDDGGRLLATKMGEAHAGSTQLADGAGRLADGVRKAYDGSGQLDDGARRLVDGLRTAHHGGTRLKHGTASAANGGRRLASGLGDLSTGAEDLQGGLSLLETGSRDLANGFNNPAGQDDLVSGSRNLVVGLQQIRDGVNQLADEQGIPKAAAGAAALEAGIDTILAKVGSPDDPSTLLGGLAALESGLNNDAIPGAKAIDAGVGQLLSTTSGLPAAKGGVDQAKAGVDALKAGVDQGLASANPDALQQLVDAVESAKATDGCNGDPVCVGTLAQVVTGIGGVADGLEKTSADLTALSGGLGQVSGGLGQVSGGLGVAIGKIQTELKPGTEALVNGLTQAVGGADQLSVGASNLQAALAVQVRPGLHDLVTGLDSAVAGLDLLAPGTEAAADGAGKLATGIFNAGQGADTIADGLGAANAGARRLASGAQRADAGGRELSGGLGVLDGGMFDLLEGLGLLKDGSVELHDGTGRLEHGLDRAAHGSDKLADGTIRLEDGLSRLAHGAADLSAGATKAADGSGDLSDGAARLSDGLADAADGSGRLADGLGQAAAGAPRMVDGAQRLSDEGMGQLVDSGMGTAQSFGEKYAVLKAAALRAEQEGMAYGAPAGAEGATAFTYELAGADGEGSRNLERGIGAVVILAAAVAVAGLRRRFA